MKQLFVGNHPNVVKFSDLDGRDRICEIRVLIASAYTMLRDAIGAQAKNESNTFHGPWLVFRNLMNDHPAACLEEFRHASIYFDADTDGKVTEIADLIEQHIELTRQGLDLKGLHQHQADAMVGIASTAGSMETTVVQGLGKTRGHNSHLELSESFRGYLDKVQAVGSTFEICTLLTTRFGKPSFRDFTDNTVEEMHQITCDALLAATESVSEVRSFIGRAIISFGLPMPMPTTVPSNGNFDFDIGDNQAADDENFAFRS